MCNWYNNPPLSPLTFLPNKTANINTYSIMMGRLYLSPQNKEMSSGNGRWY